MRAENKAQAAELGVEAIKEVFEGSAIGIFLKKDNLVAESVFDPENVILEIPEFEPGEGLAGKAFDEGEPRLYNNLDSEKGVYNEDTSIMSELIVPLGEHGLLMVGSTDKTIDTDDFYLAKIVGANIESIMDRIEREKTVRERLTEIEKQGERLEEFSSVVSHDLRNPLNLAKGYLDLAKETKDTQDFQEVEKALDKIEEVTEHLIFLAREPKEMESTDVSIDQVFQDVWLNTDTQKSSYSIDDTQVKADPIALKKIIENLLDRSLKNNDKPLEISLGPIKEGFYFEYNGEGSSEIKDARVKKKSKSENDFGFSVVKSLIDAHGGDLVIKDLETGGTRFEFRF